MGERVCTGSYDATQTPTLQILTHLSPRRHLKLPKGLGFGVEGFQMGSPLKPPKPGKEQALGGTGAAWRGRHLGSSRFRV